MDDKWVAYFFLNPGWWLLANEADYAINSDGVLLWETAAWNRRAE